MSESNYGYCNYCGKYRPLKWNGGYCSEKCYCESGQKEQDIIDSEERYELWYYRDDVGAFIYRSIVMSIGWLTYMIGAKWFMEGNLVGLVIEDDGMTEADFKETMLGLNAEFEALNEEAKKLEAQISLNLRGLFTNE